MKNRFLLPGIILLSISAFIVIFFVINAPVVIHVRIAEDGGFKPDYLQAKQGVPLKLRMVSDDVKHSFAIGHYPMEPVTLEPGIPVDITVTFDDPGIYTFYSSTPSSINFWRLRGTIEVIGDGPPPLAEPPLYVQLGLSLDEDHETGETHDALPDWMRSPSAKSGAVFENLIPSETLNPDYYLLHSPMEVFESLHDDHGLGQLSELEIWDLVAFIWQQNTNTDALAQAELLYQANCAACHGSEGKGDGQFADEMSSIANNNQDPHGIQAPTAFIDPEHLLDDAPVVLQGLILRGGMGTGMPMWGSIFTDQQLWNLVAYLYTFQFR